jgi:hypothetical protein
MADGSASVEVGLILGFCGKPWVNEVVDLVREILINRAL